MSERGRAFAAGRLAGALATLVLLVAGAGTPAGAAAPVLCSTVASKGELDVLTCRRQDTGASFTQVPTEKFLHVTDVLANRNDLSDTGDFYLTLGRDAGGSHPSRPRIALSGLPRESMALHFETPILVLESGEPLAAYTDPSSEFAANLYVSGFLADRVLVPEPGAVAQAGAALGGLALVAALRRHRQRARPAAGGTHFASPSPPDAPGAPGASSSGPSPDAG